MASSAATFSCCSESLGSGPFSMPAVWATMLLRCSRIHILTLVSTITRGLLLLVEVAILFFEDFPLGLLQLFEQLFFGQALSFGLRANLAAEGGKLALGEEPPVLLIVPHADDRGDRNAQFLHDQLLLTAVNAI